MSIEVNGVSLPDIPSEVLEQYPYAVALDFTASYGATTIMLYCSAAPFCYYPAEYPDDIDYALLKTSSVQVTCAYSPSITGSEDWFVGEAEESGGIVVEEYDGGYISISWANHDIAKMDADGNDTGEIYFPSSVSVSYYAAPKSWYDGMAQQVMRLTGTSDKLTTDEMLELLTALNADSDGDTGGGSVTIVPWSTGTDEEIAAMVAAMDAGTISIEDTGWAIGDERTVTLSVMSATGVGENHTEQTVTMVLMDSQHYTLTEATAGGDTKDHFVVGMKNCLAEKAI